MLRLATAPARHCGANASHWRQVASGDGVSRFGKRSTGRDSRLGLATVASRPGGSCVAVSDSRSLGTGHCGSCRCISECFECGCKVPYQSRLKVVLGASDLVGFGPVTRASGRSGVAPPPAPDFRVRRWALFSSQSEPRRAPWRPRRLRVNLIRPRLDPSPLAS